MEKMDTGLTNQNIDSDRAALGVQPPPKFPSTDTLEREPRGGNGNGEASNPQAPAFRLRRPGKSVIPVTNTNATLGQPVPSEPHPETTLRRRSISEANVTQQSMPAVLPTNATSKKGLKPSSGEEDYTKTYPNDEYGMEMGPEARLWRTYLDEAKIIDKDNSEDNNSTLDGILIFAAIFSAIVTTFVTQTYQSLQQDPQAISAVLLLELIAVQRALSNGSSVNEIPSSEGLDADFAPASSDIWINGLWFLSLVLSLLIVFLGVLAKQWLHQYDAVTSGPPRTRALIRQARYSGLRKWHVHTLIGILPIVIHISLALFFAGLVILLRSMLLNLAYFVAGIVGAVYLAYFVSNFLPIFYPFCPYRTSLTPKLYHLCSLLSLLRVRLAQVPDEPPTSPVMSQKRQRWGSFPWHLRLPQISLSAKPVRWRDAESKAFTNTGGLMEIEAASWLYTSSFNLTAQQVALEGLAGLQQDYSEGKAIKSTSQALDALNGECERLCSLREHDYATTERQLELVLRALIQTQSPLIPQNEDEYQQPKLPNGVEEFCHDNEIGPQLTTLLTCGWFERPYGLSVNVDEFLINAVETQASSPQLPAHSWVALLRAAPRSVIGNLNKKNPYKLKLTRELLTVLFKVGSFAPTEGTPTPTVAKNAVTTIHHPSQAMCLAMFDAVCIISGTYTGTPTTPPQIVLATINLLLWVGEPTTSADADAVSTANVVLDYLLQSVQPANSKIKELSTLWTSADRRNVNTTLSRFLRTDFAVSCGSVESEPSEIWRKTLALMEHVFLRADHGRASVLWLEGNPERALHVYLDYMNGNDTGGIPHSNTSPWWQRGGLELVLSAMDMGDIAIFKRMLVIDVIPALFNVWSKESQYYARDPTAPAFIKHYLASILPKDALYRKDSAAPEYQSDQTRYIHTPENLYHLSRILLHSDAVHSNENTILKLLSLDPKNLSWIQCLNMLRKWVPEKDKWENEYAMSANITRAYETIEDIQYILGIADNNLESNVDWQSRYAINTQIPDGRKRLRDVHSDMANDPSASQRPSWNIRMRKLFHFEVGVCGSESGKQTEQTVSRIESV